jgi:RNA-binding protein
MTTKQRAYLRSLGHDLEPIFQIGKLGVTPEVVNAIDAALEARELIKVTVLNNCEDDVRDVCERVSSRTHSEPVQVIGHKFILYRAAKKPKIELPPAKRS